MSMSGWTGSRWSCELLEEGQRGLECEHSTCKTHQTHQTHPTYPSIWFYLILFDSIWFYLILFDSIWFYLILFDSIWFYLPVSRFQTLVASLAKFSKACADDKSTWTDRCLKQWFVICMRQFVLLDWHLQWLEIWRNGGWVQHGWLGHQQVTSLWTCSQCVTWGWS